MKQYTLFDYATHSQMMGEADSLNAAKRMATKMKAYWTNTGWVKPEIFRSDDCIEWNGERFPNPYASAVTVWHSAKERWIEI